MEVPETTSTAALFLELSVLPIKFEFEIQQRQLFFLKCILDKDPDDPVHVVYKEQLKCNSDNLPLNDEDIKRITLSQ